jgi:hypothetical protein
VVVAGEVLVFVVVVVVVTFSGSLAQDPSANKNAQTRQTPMDFFMSAILSQTATPRKQAGLAQSPQRPARRSLGEEGSAGFDKSEAG